MDLSDPVTFSRVYDEHARSVYGAALRILACPVQAQDVTQDVFVKLWRDPWRFDARRGDVGSYLRVMARSRALDVYREAQAAARAAERVRLAASIAAPADPPLAALARRHDRVRVRAALRELPHAQREAVVLAYWGGLTADQIARLVGVPLGTAKSRIRLGLAHLRDEVGAAVAPVAA